MAHELPPPECRTRTRFWKLWGTTELDLPQLSSTPHKSGVPTLRRLGPAWAVGVLAALILGSPLFAAVSGGEGVVAAATLPTPSRSTTIALTSDNRHLVVVNRETNTVSVIAVRDPQRQNIAAKFAEIPVGTEPRCVALHPNGLEAYVTNAVSGTVSVIDLFGARVLAEIPVGTEPRGCAITPNGAYLFVANHTDGSVGVIDVASRTYLGPLFPVGGNPTAIAITNNGDGNDVDETVFVTQFFAELVPGGPGEGFDTGKHGIVTAIPLTTLSPTRITLSPLSNVGFTADRTNFCP
jgi:YVTN family beta-propeller protein